MRVIEPSRRRSQKAKKSHRGRNFLVALAVLLGLAACINYLRPLPAPTVTVSIATPKVAEVVIDWPTADQSAVGSPAYGLLGNNGRSAPLATASIAKVIVALCVLEKYPLDPGQTGPVYTITSKDVAGYQQNVNQGGSLLPVVVGGKLTEYQAIEALMIPSANNIADSLVRWGFGDHDAYKTYATNYLRANGLNDTKIGSDASGYEADTISTATDLVKLGELALKSPVLMEIASKKSTVLPVAGRVNNYNTVLGVNGITGLKTGNNDADPGAFAFTANVQVGDKTVPVTGAVMGAADLQTALNGSTQIAASLQNGFEEITVAGEGQVVGTMRTAWGASAPIMPTKAVQLVRWKANEVKVSKNLGVDWHASIVGMLTASTGDVKAGSQLKLAHPIAGPSVWWRLTRH